MDEVFSPQRALFITAYDQAVPVISEDFVGIASCAKVWGAKITDEITEDNRRDNEC